jgi:hypothetical protein
VSEAGRSAGAGAHLRLVFMAPREQRHRLERIELAEQFAKVAAELAQKADAAREEMTEFRLAARHWKLETTKLRRQLAISAPPKVNERKP